MRSARNHLGYRVGECHQKSKLTDAQVREIRQLYRAGGTSYARLANQFGCGESTVRDIVTNRTRWSA